MQLPDGRDRVVRHGHGPERQVQTGIGAVAVQRVRRWREIVRQPIPRAAKQQACLALLVALVDKLATARVGQPNAPLRFFADMVRLRRLLLPFQAMDDFGRIALSPAWKIVGDWLHANAFANGTKSIGGPVALRRTAVSGSSIVSG